MSVFICENCGKLDNTALSGNYFHAVLNKHKLLMGEKISTCYNPEFEYFENHVCCADCCEGIIYKDGSIFHKRNMDTKEKYHWTKYGKEILLEWEKRNDGSMVNATEYFKNIGEIK